MQSALLNNIAFGRNGNGWSESDGMGYLILNNMHCTETPSRRAFYTNGIRNFMLSHERGTSIRLPLIKMLNRYYGVITCNLFLLNFLVLLFTHLACGANFPLLRMDVIRK